MQIITTPTETKEVHDYIFNFSGAEPYIVTLDPSMGDSINIDRESGLIWVHLEAKPSIADPQVKLAAQDITLFASHVLYIQHQTRQTSVITPEQQYAWMEAVAEAGGQTRPGLREAR